MTKKGIVKRTKFYQFENIRKNGLIAINLRDGDELINVRKTNGNDELIAITSEGMSIRFPESDVREMGRNSMGVIGVRLSENDHVVSMDMVENDKFLLIVSEFGFGKITPLSEYRTQSRAGKGIKTYNIKTKTGKVVSAKVVDKSDEIMMISLSGIIIRLNVNGISEMGRNTQGVTLMKIENEDRVVAVAKYVEE
jgi:DNA gyrase subunit A